MGKESGRQSYEQPHVLGQRIVSMASGFLAGRERVRRIPLDIHKHGIELIDRKGLTDSGDQPMLKIVSGFNFSYGGNRWNVGESWEFYPDRVVGIRQMTRVQTRFAGRGGEIVYGPQSPPVEKEAGSKDLIVLLTDLYFSKEKEA